MYGHVYRHVYIHVQRHVDMCIDMCMGMYIDMCIDLCIDMCGQQNIHSCLSTNTKRRLEMTDPLGLGVTDWPNPVEPTHVYTHASTHIYAYVYTRACA